jgi:hypothetical protein
VECDVIEIARDGVFEWGVTVHAWINHFIPGQVISFLDKSLHAWTNYFTRAGTRKGRWRAVSASGSVF